MGYWKETSSKKPSNQIFDPQRLHNENKFLITQTPGFWSERATEREQVLK